MPQHNREFGVIGLGRMGGNLALQALEQGYSVIGFDRKPASDELRSAGLRQLDSLSGFVDALMPPRAIFVYVPAGPIVDTIVDDVAATLANGDIVIDGGNSYWGDSIRREQRLGKQGVHLVDLGTSGGVDGARHGACFMAGGVKKAIDRVEPILLDLATDGGYVHAGPPGAGHFAKLVHNGIEFGMLQAIGEGVDLLERYHDELNIKDVLRCWRHGSVIRSWLVDLMEKLYREKGGLDDVPGFVEDTGEVNWLVGDAMRMEVPVPVIAQSVMQLFASRDERKNWARAIAMMRHGFGGHPFGPDEGIRRERTRGRVGEIYRPEGE